MSLQITSVTYRRSCGRSILTVGQFSRVKTAKPLEGFVKRWVLKSLLLLLVASSLQAEQVPSIPASDTIFLWLAGGISSARIQRLIQTGDRLPTELVSSSALSSSCHATTQCTRALQKAGADAGLIQSLKRHSSDQKSDQNGDRKPAASAASACSSPAAQIAALVHDRKFDGAEDKIRSLLRDDAVGALPNAALLNYVLGTILRRQDRFDEALDAFTESSRSEERRVGKECRSRWSPY